MRFLTINISHGSVATLFRCGDVCNNPFIADFLLSITVKEFFKNGSTLLKYPPEYTAYFFEPPCMLLYSNARWYLNSSLFT